MEELGLADRVISPLLVPEPESEMEREVKKECVGGTRDSVAKKVADDVPPVEVRVLAKEEIEVLDAVPKTVLETLTEGETCID